MRAAYLFTIPRPPKPELDGAVQEAGWLRERFGGEIHYLYPVARHRRWIPHALCGVRQLGALRRLDREVDLHHLFSGGLRSVPSLGVLGKPIVYTLLTGLEAPVRLDRSTFWGRLAAVVVPDTRSAELLAAAGLNRVEVVPPGLELERFSRQKPPAGEELVLLVGSAPWSRRQFETKGFDMLFEAAARLPQLRLVLLWRGLLREEAERRVRAHGLGERVEIIDRTVDVNEILGRAHAAVALTRDRHLLKAFPHSLLEALAAGRPIVASAGLAIAELVRTSGAGVIVPSHDVESLIAALRELMSSYATLAEGAEQVDLSAYSRGAFLAGYSRVYDRVTRRSGTG